MIDYKPGEIVLIDFPFSDGAGAKRRPAVVLLDTGDNDILVARVTSQPKLYSFDVEISDWRGAGLALPSIVRLDKLATLEKALVTRTLGKLKPSDHQTVAVTLRQLFAAW